MNKLSVVIPAWNEREAIARVIERVLAVKDALRLEAGVAGLEVLVVDDGSSDGTTEIVARLAAAHPRAGVRLISHRTNQGYGAALQAGLDRATGDLLAFLDADCTYPPERLPALCQAARMPGIALVLGDRMSSRSSQMPALRRLGNWFFSHLVSLLARTHVSDCCSGMRVLPVATWRTLGPLPRGLDFTPAMTMRVLYRDLALREVVIPYHERVGRSKLKTVRDGLRFLGTILRETWTGNRGRLLALAGQAIVLPLLALAGATLALSTVEKSSWASVAIRALGVLALFAGLSLARLRLAGWARPAAPHLALPQIANPGGRAAQGEEERAS